MNKIKSKPVKSKKCEEWINSGFATLRNDLRSPDMEGFLDYYVLNDGGLLLRTIFEKKNGIVYETYDEYLEMQSRFRKRQSLTEQYGSKKDASFSSYLRITLKDFENMLPSSAQLLENSFSLKPHSLDYSIRSLKLLSKAIKKVLDKVDLGDFEEKYIFLITAYCGEVMRKKIDGEWVIKGDDEGMVCQILIIEKGKPEFSYRPEIPLSKILAGDVPNRLDVEVDSQLYKYGFIKGNNVSDISEN